MKMHVQAEMMDLAYSQRILKAKCEIGDNLVRLPIRPGAQPATV